MEAKPSMVEAARTEWEAARTEWEVAAFMAVAEERAVMLVEAVVTAEH
jgi:hypothetical protein